MTSSKKKKKTPHPVRWAAGVVGTLFLGWITNHFNLLPFDRWIVEALTAKYVISRWYAWLLGLGDAAVIVVLVVVWLEGKREVTFHDYCEDTFDGVKWKWRYDGNQVNPSSIVPYCVRCGLQMTHTLVAVDFGRGWGCTLHCEGCGHQLEVPKEFDNLRVHVAHLIEREVTEERWEAKVTALRVPSA